MAVGRISGPLLAQNLFRDNVPLAFYNSDSTESPVLYLDVTNGRVGIKTASPAYELDVNGTINANQIRTTTATIGNFVISSNTVATVYGPVIVQPGGLDGIFLQAPTQVTDLTQSTSTDTGALIVAGGQGIGGNLYVGGDTNIVGIVSAGSTATFGSSVNITGPTRIFDQTNSTSTNTGALVVDGGVGIAYDLWVGGYIYGHLSTATLAEIVTATTLSTQLAVTNTATTGTYFPLLSSTDNGLTYLQAQTNLYYDIALQKFVVRNISLGTTTTDTLEIQAEITGDLIPTITDTYNVGNTASIWHEGHFNTVYANTIASIAGNGATTGSISISGTLNVGGGLNVAGTSTVGGGQSVGGNQSVNGNQSIGGNQSVTGNQSAGGNSNVGGNQNVAGNSSIGGNQQVGGNQSVGGNLSVQGNIRVIGNNPIGTAPVVTNILYVTMDGNDTNDGRAEDASRACRTIGAAIKSPYYGPGTAIKVAPGYYLENNPLVLQPYTSILGADLRTTSIEPINKTQDLFHVQSGCYLFGMQFLNGRSGILPGTYANDYNRGAYAIAFPPLVSGEKIDVYHSPYVQNCTNQSGPWLYDGTMFQPNQTVQIPLVVGTGTWAANTTTIVIKSDSPGGITGLSVNSGPQDPGFFNARTLLLANKGYIQEQVVTYVNQTYPDFVYQQAKCFRDVGIIIENVAYDSTFGGNQKSIEAGLAYWVGVQSVISGQQVETTAAIDYINSLAQSIITNSPTTDLTGGMGIYSQVINTNLTGGVIASDSIYNNLQIITTIINSGPDAAPTLYLSSGPDTAFVSAEILLQANRSFIQSDTQNWINNTYPTFYYQASSCYRDVGLIVDAIAHDILFTTSSQSTFAGIQYYNHTGYVGAVGDEINTTTDTINYISSLAQQIVVGDTGGTRYQNTVSQITSSTVATSAEATYIANDFTVITDILSTGTVGITDRIVPNGLIASTDTNVVSAYDLLQSNKEYMQAEAIAFITNSNPYFTYDTATCVRDVGYMVDSISFDLLYGGNWQAVQSGVYYYGYSTSTSIEFELPQVIAAYQYLDIVVSNVIRGKPLATPYQTVVTQITNLSTGTAVDVVTAQASVQNILNIITNGPDGIVKQPISLTQSTSTTILQSAEILEANRTFIQTEIAAYVNFAYPGLVNNKAKSYRDVGLVVDAVSQDIVLGGNSKTVEAAVSFWTGGYAQLTEHAEVCTAALSYARDVATQVIANSIVSPQAGNTATQIINTYFENGSVATAAVQRNFNIITDVITNGVASAPTRYQGGGLFASIGVVGDDVKTAPKVLQTVDNNDGTFTITLDRETVGFGTNATLYFGKTAVFPVQEGDVPDRWQQRRVDPKGAMGGMLVDGGVVSDRSPIASMVLNAFTQVSQGGRGIHIINNGYAQLVSIFTIFCNVAVEVDSGGIASITNSNSNFGDICLIAKGYGRREFSGTVYNPPYPNFITNGEYYPSGFYPQNGNVLIFVPDTANRPHIALVMEVVPPLGYINVQSLPGFLTSAPNIATLTTGSITISGIDTTDIAIGQSLFVRDQYGRQQDDGGFMYVNEGTVVTDVGYQTITLNQAINQGGGDPLNATYFTLYVCGNAYYTVLSSNIFPNPVPVGESMIPGIQTLEAQSLDFVSALTQTVISNSPTIINYSTTDQTFISGADGSGSASFIASDFLTISDIVVNGVGVAPGITKTGAIPTGAGDAISLIEANVEFITQETIAYLTALNEGKNYDKCARDIRLILQQIIYDLGTGGNYNAVYSGLSYWSRNGTYHLVNLEENLTNPGLMPDGATVNFYQRSYMSASGYTFEYVGAGMNYGSLPQVGRADPNQSKEVLQLSGGKVFFTSTDQNGDFRIGPDLVISQATGVLSGRTFTKSLFANMTPFILAIESGA